MEYKIETKIKAPRVRWKHDFPFDKMKKGDSFLEVNADNINALRVYAHNYSKSKNKKVKFSILKEKKGYRCYRIL